MVRVEAWFAMAAAFSSVPRFFRKAVMLVVWKVWLADLCSDSGGSRAAADHRTGVGLGQGSRREPVGSRPIVRNNGPFGSARKSQPSRWAIR